MKYLCLACYDGKKFDALPKNEVGALVRPCTSRDEAPHAGGHWVPVGSLAPARPSASLRPKNGEPSVTGGPFAEPKERIGAFFIIEARDLNEAVRVAAAHPGEQAGWGMEVRPVEFFAQS